MPKVRKITRNLDNKRKNYYLVDASFLLNKYVPPEIFRNDREKQRVCDCQKWWEEINAQLKKGHARVYIPAACIAESFKNLAKLAFHPKDKRFCNTQQYNNCRKRLSRDISLSPSNLRSFSRKIRYHDIPMDRDIIISVDRFYELFTKYTKTVGIIDLSLAATAKYLMDFFDISKDQLHIITLDTDLREGIGKSQDLPIAYDPTLKKHSVDKIFK